MSKKSKFLALAVAGLALTAANSSQAKIKMEKCYGVVKAGKNDCGSARAGGHSCAGAAKVDGDPAEWIFLPKGDCDRLVNGSTKPKV